MPTRISETGLLNVIFGEDLFREVLPFLMIGKRRRDEREWAVMIQQICSESRRRMRALFL